MLDQAEQDDEYQLGDKVRVKVEPYLGARGILQNFVDGFLEVKLDDGNVVKVSSEKITNYSLAARRAWKSMPKKAGRPQLPAPRKKMVSIRVDIELWSLLGKAVELGKYTSREDAINNWLYENLKELL